MTQNGQNPPRANATQQRREAYVAGLEVSDAEYQAELLEAKVEAAVRGVKAVMKGLDQLDQLDQEGPIRGKLIMALREDFAALARKAITGPGREDGPGGPFEASPTSPPSTGSSTSLSRPSGPGVGPEALALPHAAPPKRPRGRPRIHPLPPGPGTNES
jgi:hypothetical protein